MDQTEFSLEVKKLANNYESLVNRPNIKEPFGNGIYDRYQYPILTADHAPYFWKYDLNFATNPNLLQRIGINGAFNSGAILFEGRYLLVARVEGWDRKSFFAVVESPDGVNYWRFWDFPIALPDIDPEETNVYDMRLTKHEDGWIYGVFCSEAKDPKAAAGDLSSAIAKAGIVRTKDLKTWERLPNLKTRYQQRNVVLHPEFYKGKYVLYTRPMDGFIDAGSGGGIGWALVDDITKAEVKDELIIDARTYHTIKESKNGQGPHPIKTSKGWLHLAHGVRGCAAGLRYVLYLFMTDLKEPWKPIANPGGYLLAPEGSERIGDVSNVVFSNGWIANDKGEVFIYYGASDTRMYVATSTIDRLVDYCLHTPPDGQRTHTSVAALTSLIERNLKQLRN